MTFDKKTQKLKRLTRERMAQTGEPYTEARNKVLSEAPIVSITATGSKGAPGTTTWGAWSGPGTPLPEFGANGARWGWMKDQLELSKDLLFHSEHKTWNIVVPIESGGPNSDTLPEESFPLAVAAHLRGMAGVEGYQIAQESKPSDPADYALGAKKLLLYVGAQDFHDQGGRDSEQLVRQFDRDQHSVCIVVTPEFKHDPLLAAKQSNMKTLNLCNPEPRFTAERDSDPWYRMHKRISELTEHHRKALSGAHNDIFNSEGRNIWSIVVPDGQVDGLEVYVDNVVAHLSNYALKSGKSIPSLVRYPEAAWIGELDTTPAHLIFESMNDLVKYGANSCMLMNVVSQAQDSAMFVVTAESESKRLEPKLLENLPPYIKWGTIYMPRSTDEEILLVKD